MLKFYCGETFLYKMCSKNCSGIESQRIHLNSIVTLPTSIHSGAINISQTIELKCCCFTNTNPVNKPLVRSNILIELENVNNISIKRNASIHRGTINSGIVNAHSSRKRASSNVHVHVQPGRNLII